MIIFLILVDVGFYMNFTGNKLNIQLQQIEALSNPEKISNPCSSVGGWCFSTGKPTKGLHII